MDERRLQIFRAVAEERNFTRAADRLHMAQPTVSQQIQALEEYLGERLFDRTSKSVTLTPAGQALYGQAGALLRQMAEVRRAVAEAAGNVGGNLTVGASLTIGEYVLPQVLAAFVREFPAVRVQLQIENTEAVVHQVLAGAVDLGLVEGPVPAADLMEEPFLADELVFIAPSAHPWRLKPSITLADLQGEPLILREAGSGTRRVLEEHLQAAGVAPDRFRRVIEMAGTEAIKGAVEAGMGVACISRWTIQKELRLGTLLARTISGLPVERTFRAISLRGRSLIPSAAALMRRLGALAAPGKE